eukprot:m.142624 g.142624  ORF g.142624 m.142624 type:complete len:458 (+) comp30260_c0_seq1:171-1544(+)
MSDPSATLEELRKQEALNQDLVVNVTEMENIILSLRDLLTEQEDESLEQKHEIAELKTELELTQQQVLELANIVESNHKMDEVHSRIDSRNDISSIQLKKKLVTTEKAFLGAKDRISNEQRKVTALTIELKNQELLLKEKMHEFALWKTEAEEKQRMRESLSTEQDKLISSLEEQLDTKKNQIITLSANKETEHGADVEAIEARDAELVALHEANDKAVFELEENHAAEISRKDEEVKEEHLKFTAAKEQWGTEKQNINNQHEEVVAQLKHEHQTQIAEYESSIVSIKADHGKEIETMKEQKVEDFAGKNKEIGRLKGLESELYDTQIEMSVLEAKYKKLECDWDARHKWRKEHKHKRVMPMVPPGNPHPGFGKPTQVLDLENTDIKEFTFTSAPVSLGVVVSPSPRKLPVAKKNNTKATPTRRHPLATSTSNVNIKGKTQKKKENADPVQRKVQFK